MTTICGIAENGRVYIGVDTRITTHEGVRNHDMKLFMLTPEILLGVCGSVRMAQIIKHHVELTPQAGGDDEDYIVGEVVENIRLAMIEQGHTIETGGQWQDGGYLIGYRGRLYHVYADYSVAQNSTKIDAAGSGSMFAIGVIRALEALTPQERIGRALEVSAEFDLYTGAPFRIGEI